MKFVGSNKMCNEWLSIFISWYNLKCLIDWQFNHLQFWIMWKKGSWPQSLWIWIKLLSFDIILNNSCCLAPFDLWIEIMGDMWFNLVLGKSLHALFLLEVMTMRISIVTKKTIKKFDNNLSSYILEIIQFQASPPMKFGWTTMDISINGIQRSHDM